MFPQSMHHFLHRWGPGPEDGDIPPPTSSASSATDRGGEGARLVVASPTTMTGGGLGADLQTHPLVGRGGDGRLLNPSSPSIVIGRNNPLAFAWTRAVSAVTEAATIQHLRLLDAVRDLSSSPGAGAGLLSTIGSRFQKLAYQGRNGISATALGEYAMADPYDDEDVEELLVSQAQEISDLRERVRQLEREVNEMEEGMENRHVVSGADDSFYRRLGVDEDEFDGGTDSDDDDGDDDVLDPDGPRARMRGQRRTIRILEGRVEYLLGLINLLEMMQEMEFYP